MRYFFTVKHTVVLFFLVAFFNANSQNSNLNGDAIYNPRFWVDGIADDVKANVNTIENNVATIVSNASLKGWGGILYWGANYNGAKMNYFYKSPFLQKQTWAIAGKDGLTPLVKAAHNNGLKVMVNIEGVNPYHWQQHQWTSASIAAAANDLIVAGTDAVFEECFEVKQDVFTSLAKTLKNNNVAYVSGTDPMLLRESNFVKLWPKTGMINLYDYYLKRDKMYSIATLAQNGSLGLGWAKYWKKPTSITSPIDRDWGIANDYSSAVVSYLCMIRALQFRVDNFMILGGMDTFHPAETKAWIQSYVSKQEKDRPVMNIVVLLKKEGSYADEAGWNNLFNSADAITSGAFNAGYNIIVSDKVLPADAYFIYANGGKNDTLPTDVTAIFNTDKPVFLQATHTLPNGLNIEANWKKALDQCGVDGTKKMLYAGSGDHTAKASLPENQAEEIPYTGYYKNQYLRFTGTDIQRGKDLRTGTIIPEDVIKGSVLAYPNKTYGKGPYIVAKNNKYLITTTALNWQVSYPISNLLSGGGIMPSSNVWGIVGKNVTALLAIETTELILAMPNILDGTKMHVVIWDNKKNKKMDEVITYRKPFKQMLKEYDFMLIDRIE